MPCKRCDHVPTVKDQFVTVYLYLPTHHHEGPLETLLEDNDYAFDKHESYYLIYVKTFEAFIELLSRNFNELEKQDIMLLPLKYLNLLQFEDLQKLKSLETWISFYSTKEIRYILEHKSVKIQFQPIMNVSDNTVYGYEALARGYDETGQLVPPDAMFSQAKSADLMFNLDKLCREKAIEFASKLKLSEKLFINFIPTSIYDPEKCLKSTNEALLNSCMRAEQVVFEVVETEKVSDFDHLNRILNYYRSRGYETALDDLGSGYSNKEALLNLHPNYIKIDRSIIQDIHLSKEKQLEFDRYVTLAQEKNIIVLAEGIETQAELDYIKAHHATLAQGYYYTKPSNTLYKP